MTISGWKIFIWGCIPRLFSSPHRKLLCLEVNKRGAIEIDNDGLRTILRLAEEGFNIRIFRVWMDLDDLQQFKGGSREVDLSQILDVADHALEDKPAKEGFLFSFSSFLSRIFCRR